MSEFRMKPTFELLAEREDVLRKAPLETAVLDRLVEAFRQLQACDEAMDWEKAKAAARERSDPVLAHDLEQWRVVGDVFDHLSSLASDPKPSTQS